MNTRSRAAASLGKIKPSNRVAIAALVKAATTFVDSDEYEILIIFGGRDSSDLSVDLRWQAVRALGNIGKDAKEAVPCLLEVVRTDKGLYPYCERFQDENGSYAYNIHTTVLAAAVQSLVEIDPKSKKITRALRKQLHSLRHDEAFPEGYHQDICVSIAGALAVMNPNDQDALKVLRAAMRADDSTTKAIAARWIGRSGVDKPDIVLALQAAVDDEDAFLRNCARDALHQISKSEAIEAEQD
jgi:HEAT repeat protein